MSRERKRGEERGQNREKRDERREKSEKERREKGGVKETREEWKREE